MKKSSLSKTELRQQAEAKLSRSRQMSKTVAETQHLVHELEVHQIELEMQNEELLRARTEAESLLHQYTDLYQFAPIGYFTLTSNSAIRQINLAGANLLGMEPLKLINRRFGVFVSAQSRNTFNTFLEKVFSTSENKETCEITLQRPNADLLWLQLEAASENGQECRLAAMNITARKKGEEMIRQYASDLEMRVQERTAELVYANRVKDEFLTNMSHELRTPLNTILGFSEVLLQEVYGPMLEEQERAVQRIHSSGKHLLVLINDILDVSRIETGTFEVHPALVNVDEICQASLIFVKDLAAKKSVTVEYSCSSAASTIFADPKRLKQILVNLLHNAVKFTPEMGMVKLNVQALANEGLMRFSVTDTGIGIKPESLQKLFIPFVQLDSSLNRQYEGTGLGLALTKIMVEKHGGSIEVESRPGEGSRFTFILPWDQTMEDKVNPDHSKNEDQQRNKTMDAILNGRSIILIADDNETSVMVIKDHLELHGHKVFVAHDGDEVMQKDQELVPDLILMDLQMLPVDGVEATRRLRADPRFGAVPIIALISQAMPRERQRCLDAGINEYLSKPVNLKKLTQMIDVFLRHAPDS